MKTKHLILLLGLLLLNSCIVKSLHPFYTENTIFFEKRFIGTWDDSDNKSKCEVFSFKEKYLEINNKAVSELSKEQIEEYNKYKDGYFVIMTNDGKEAEFVAMPFKIGEQLFMDFSIVDVDLKAINDLANFHLMGMHSLVKVEFTKDNSMVNLKYFGEEKLKELINSNKIKIKHEKTGYNEEGYLLTASSIELQKFIKKYMNSKDDDKWATDIEFNYTK